MPVTGDGSLIQRLDLGKKAALSVSHRLWWGQWIIFSDLLHFDIPPNYIIRMPVFFEAACFKLQLIMGVHGRFVFVMSSGAS
jgi:hypothetical protein